MNTIKIKRVYVKPETSDAYRVLIDRLWPRGLTKEKAALDEWLKEIAPSNELRKWFHANGDYQSFVVKYKEELKEKEEELTHLKNLFAAHDLTLLYASRDEEHNHAIILKEILEGKE